MEANRNLSNFIGKLVDSFNKEVARVKKEIKECNSDEERAALTRELLNLTGG
ncbi:hypothetical protein ACWN8V_06675 [Vagococcus elongatus]|uniref:hypothetical protein n=1 Tax=Vagococcus elongatus TaxID=180344 RepID=UPI0014770DF6|nr:hypothetical protein [Vagococcus elongatus]